MIEKVFENDEMVTLTEEEYNDLVYIVNVTRILPSVPPTNEVEVEDGTSTKYEFEFSNRYHESSEADQKGETTLSLFYVSRTFWSLPIGGIWNRN